MSDTRVTKKIDRENSWTRSEVVINSAVAGGSSARKLAKTSLKTGITQIIMTMSKKIELIKVMRG
jgi:ribosomal protein L19